MSRRYALALACLAAFGSASAGAQHADQGHAAHEARPRECTPEHAAMGHCVPARPQPRTQADACTPEHAAMGHCTPVPRAQPPREPIPPVTDADRAAAFPALAHARMAHGVERYGRVVFNRLEAWDGDHGTGQAWEGSASYGGDVQRLWLRGSGEREGGRTASSEFEALYGRAISPWWDAVAGVKHDVRPASSQTWAALGIQGLAPYLFDVSATAYLGTSGRLAAKLEAGYELLLTNRLILQPLVEVELHSQDDPRRGIGSGLSKAEAGLRLRYEVTRRFAPYLGIAHERSFGRTADLREGEGEGEASRETRVVAGVRFWF